MLQECRDAARNMFLIETASSVLDGPDDSLAEHLLGLCKKWGPGTASLVDRFYVGATTSLSLGVDAKTGSVVCDHDGERHEVPYIFIGSRLYYFIWRINMLCATAWDVEGDAASPQLLRLVVKPDWPRVEHVEQARIAVRMYFSDADFIDTEGLDEFNAQIFGAEPPSALLSLYIVDLAELFVLFHEIQHHIPLDAFHEEGIGVKFHLPPDLRITVRRAQWWESELTRDGNAMALLFESATKVLENTTDLSCDEARSQAGSIVFGGVDATLDTIQRLEEIRLGKVPLARAAFAPEFVRHPPSQFRRDSLSLVAYSLLTRNRPEDMRAGVHPPEWRIVAQNIYEQMTVRDRLFTAMEVGKDDNGND